MSKIKMPKNSDGDLLTVPVLCERLRSSGFSHVSKLETNLIHSRMLAQSNRKSPFIGTLPHVLTPGFAKSIVPTDFLYSRKLDGVRAMGCKLRNVLYLFFRNGKVMKIAAAAGPDFLCDIEVVADKTSLVLYVLDVIEYDGVKGQNFSPFRLNNLYKVVDFLNPLYGFTVADQYYTSYRNLIRKHQDDWEGIVATRMLGKYDDDFITQVYKYVFPNRMTIDLVVVGGEAKTSDDAVVFKVAIPDGCYEFSIDGEVIRQRSKIPNSKKVVTSVMECRGFDLDNLTSCLYQSNSGVSRGIVCNTEQCQPRPVPHVLVIDDEETDMPVGNSLMELDDDTTVVIDVTGDDEVQILPSLDTYASVEVHKEKVQSLLGTLEMYDLYTVRGGNVLKDQFVGIVRRGEFLKRDDLKSLLLSVDSTEAILSSLVPKRFFHSYVLAWKTAPFLFFVTVLENLHDEFRKKGNGTKTTNRVNRARKSCVRPKTGTRTRRRRGRQKKQK